MNFLSPKKADIEELKQTIKEYRRQRVTSPDAVQEYKSIWSIICYAHFKGLRLKLKHIADIPLKDSLEADALESETLFNIESYFRHYDDDKLSFIMAELNGAKRGIAYIEKLLKAERAKRAHRAHHTRKESNTHHVFR